MKRMLCSLVLLVTMSAMGLLVGSKSASAGPVTFAGMEQALQSSNWEGTWEDGEYFTSGPAKLFLTIVGDNTVYAQFSILEGETGDYSYSVWGTIDGNTMNLTHRKNRIVLSLSEENGGLVLKGKYDVTSGFCDGDCGTFYFKKK